MRDADNLRSTYNHCQQNDFKGELLSYVERKYSGFIGDFGLCEVLAGEQLWPERPPLNV